MRLSTRYVATAVALCVLLAPLTAVAQDDPVGHERKSSAALGLIGALGGFGGFMIPQVLRASHEANGSFDAAFWWLAAIYLALAVFTLAVYRRPGSRLAGAHV